MTIIEQKHKIIQEADQHSLTETLRKHNVAQSLFHSWKREFNRNGVEGLKPKCHTVDPEIHQLQQENKRLKRFVAYPS